MYVLYTLLVMLIVIWSALLLDFNQVIQMLALVLDEL